MKYNLNISWKDIIKQASEDDLVCDITIKNTGNTDWQLFVDFILKNYHYDFYLDNEKKDLSNKTDDYLFRQGKSKLLEIHLTTDIFLECIILDSNEIELNINPKKISSLAQIKLFFEFIKNLGVNVRKKVNITIEGYKYQMIIFSPTDDKYFDKNNKEIEII